jgi:malic enzyme
MIEFTAIEITADAAGYAHAREILSFGMRGKNVSFAICDACGALVGDRDQHVKHHQTPVVG